MDFRFTPHAEADLHAILDYVSMTDGATRAERVRLDLLQAAQLLARFPRLGHPRSDFTPRALLFWPVHSFLLVYKPDARPLEVVSIVSGWRDVAHVVGDRVEEATHVNLGLGWREFVAA
jgi:antitoxin ParD1/3/4/toxin ParE1/3/4